MPATHCTIKLHRERCPLRDASAAGSMPDAKWNDKNGSGTMPAIERIGCGSDARHGLYDKNGTGKDVLLSAGLLRERCPPDARSLSKWARASSGGGLGCAHTGSMVLPGRVPVVPEERFVLRRWKRSQHIFGRHAPLHEGGAAVCGSSGAGPERAAQEGRGLPAETPDTEQGGGRGESSADIDACQRH